MDGRRYPQERREARGEQGRGKEEAGTGGVNQQTAQNGWVEVTIRTRVDAGDLVDCLDDEAVAGAWEEQGVVHLYWPSERWDEGKLSRLGAVIDQLDRPARATVAVKQVAWQDWNAAWAAAVEPLRIGRRFVIRPSWKSAPLDAGDIELIIDPKQAFGTGHHATTRMLMEWLEDIIRGGEAVIDVGTGSGILAMAAVRLGARRAVGIDHDAVALDCARESAGVNGFGPELELRVEALGADRADASGTFDLVLANLDQQTLLACRDAIGRLIGPGGRLLLSGLLDDQEPVIRQAYGETGWYVRQQRHQEGWVALELVRAEGCDGADEAGR